MGLLPNALPGYQAPIEEGLSYQEMLNGNQVKALYVMGANPAHHVEQWPSLEFLVVQDITMTETAQLADVVLPAVTFAEKDGSMTNVDSHVQAIRRGLRPMPGAKPDWEILLELAAELGQPWDYENPQDILLEIAETNPLYADLDWDELGKQGIRISAQEVTHA